jgi:hypothetical protein
MSLNLTPWPLTLKINRVPDSPKDYVCTKFGQNPLKDVDSRVFTRMLCSKNLTQWHWSLIWNPIDFQGQRSTSQGLIFRRGDMPRFAFPLFFLIFHWRMLILECSQGCYVVKIWLLDLWPWKSIGFLTLLRTKYVPSLVKIHWRMLILVFTRMLRGKNLTRSRSKVKDTGSNIFTV